MSQIAIAETGKVVLHSQRNEKQNPLQVDPIQMAHNTTTMRMIKLTIAHRLKKMVNLVVQQVRQLRERKNEKNF